MSLETPHTQPETDEINPLARYLHRLSGQERDPDIISHDHGYSRPWNARPDNLHAQPAILLFMNSIRRFHGYTWRKWGEEEVDVETVEPQQSSPLDEATPGSVDLVPLLRGDGAIDEPEDRVNKLGWSYQENRLYSKAMKILNNDRLSRLAHVDRPNAAILTHLTTAKTSNKFRALFASTCWDMKLLSWLHITLLENLSSALLNVYLTVLHSLKAKIPSLVEKLVMTSKVGAATLEVLSNHLSVDPIQPLINQLYNPEKLPGPPVFLMVPHIGPMGPRLQLWHSQLGLMGKVVTLRVTPTAATTQAYLEALVSALKAKISEVKSNSPNRPLVLMGWHIGGLIACHVALVEQWNVAAVVTLGFPVTGVHGSRGQLDDPLLDSRTPTLFVVGQNAATCGLDDVEDLRARMPRAHTGLVVVGGADDLLRVGHLKRKLEGITQTMVDRCILDEIAAYLKEVLGRITNPPGSSSNRVPHYTNSGDLMMKRKYKRRASKPSPHHLPSNKRPSLSAKPTPNNERLATNPSVQLDLSSDPATASRRTQSTDTSSTASSTAGEVGATPGPVGEGKKRSDRPGAGQVRRGSLQHPDDDHGYSSAQPLPPAKPDSPSSSSTSSSSLSGPSPTSSPAKAWMAFPSNPATRTRKVRPPKFMDV